MNSLMKRSNGNSNLPMTSFNSLVDRLFTNNTSRILDDDFWGFNGLSQRVSVPVNIRETDKSYELELVAPGLKKEDFKINLQKDILTVSFEQQHNGKQENKEEGWLRNEYKLASFTRSFQIDETVDPSKITAQYKDGILMVQLLKKEGSQQVSRTIEVS